MGINILIKAQNDFAEAHPQWFSQGGGYTLGTLLCLEEFLLLLYGQGLLQAFTSMLESLIDLTNAVVAELKLAEAAINVLIETTQSMINAVNSLISTAAGLISKFPFTDPNFLSCPIVQQIKNAISAYIPSLSGFFKAIKNGEQWILTQEYKLIRLEKQLTWYQTAIQKVEAFSIMLQAIVEAINMQYPGGKPATTIT